MSKLLDQHFLQTHLAKINLSVFDSLPSTQDYVKGQINEINQPLMCLTEQQTAGRGRGSNRQWISPYASNIYVSYLWPTPLALHQLQGLSLVVGLALATTLKNYNVDPKVKWPNDIFCRDKKIAGILIEAFKYKTGSKVIIGMGININMDNEVNITQAWTSLKQETQKEYDRNLILVELMQNLTHYLHQFEQQGLLSFMELWQQFDYLANKTISLSIGNDIISGKVSGIDFQGLLTLQLADGSIRSFSSGEASIINRHLSP